MKGDHINQHIFLSVIRYVKIRICKQYKIIIQKQLNRYIAFAHQKNRTALKIYNKAVADLCNKLK